MRRFISPKVWAFGPLAAVALTVSACSDTTGPKPVRVPTDRPMLTIGPLQAPPAGATTINIASNSGTQYCGHAFGEFAPTFATVFTGGCVGAFDLTGALAAYNPGWDTPFAGSSWIGPLALANQYTVTPGTYDFRTTFTLPAGATSPLLNLSSLADNDAIVYLNGHEVGRNTPIQDCPTGGPCNWQQIHKVTMFDNNAADFNIGGTNTIDVFLIDMRIGVGPAGSPAPPAWNGHSCALGPQPTGVGGVPTPQYAQFLAGTWSVSDCLNPAGLDFVGAAYYVPALLNDQGCSPGYWKNHDTWPSPYFPGEQFSAVFENAFPGLTLHDVLELKGGGLNALGRIVVSALLDAKSLGLNHYGLTPQQVIDQFNAVFPGGDYETLKNALEARQDDVGGRICPLN